MEASCPVPCGAPGSTAPCQSCTAASCCGHSARLSPPPCPPRRVGVTRLSSPTHHLHRSAPDPRSLRPQVIVPHATFKAWVDGTLSVGEHVWQTTAAPGLQDGGTSAPDAALGVRVRLFSTNDYLGLSSHPAVRAAYAAGSSLAGSGPRASALVAGYTDAHRALEAQLAALKRTQECLLFPTGFAANVSVLQVRSTERRLSRPSADAVWRRPGAGG